MKKEFLFLKEIDFLNIMENYKKAVSLMEKYTETLIAPAAHLLFVDDTEKNLAPARALGMQTVHYLSQEQAERDLCRLLGRI